MPNRFQALHKRIISVIYCKTRNHQKQILALEYISLNFLQTKKNWALQKNSRDKDVKYMNFSRAEKNLKFKIKFLSTLALLSTRFFLFFNFF